MIDLYERNQKSEGGHRRGPKKKERLVERAQHVETEDEGRVSGEESQDETPVKAAVPKIDAVIEDEDTRAGDEEAAEAPQHATLAAPVDNENTSSSSSEDRPILSRLELAGTKRKAEVLSKESGKIGVTITTSSPTSSSPPPAKVSSLKIFVTFCWF